MSLPVLAGPRVKPSVESTHSLSLSKKTKKTFYDLGKEAVKHKEYIVARRYFEQAVKDDPDNPEVLNMLAFVQRKTGDLNGALENYNKALQLNPRSPQAHEYLGEVYVEAAVREADTLKSMGKKGEEELENLIKAFRKAVNKL